MNLKTNPCADEAAVLPTHSRQALTGSTALIAPVAPPKEAARVNLTAKHGGPPAARDAEQVTQVRRPKGTAATVQSSAQPPPLLPRYAPIPVWGRISSMSRSATYVEIGRGNLIAKKINGRTAVDVEAGLAWIASLPDAQIGKKPPAGE